ESYLEIAVVWPFTTLLVLCRWPARLAFTILMTACYVGPLLLLRVGEWELSAVAPPLQLATFAVIVSTVFGAIHFRTVEQSHELRTPLTLVPAMLGELRATNDADARPRVETAERNAARLLVMIDELLELARFTGGRAEPKARTFDVAQLARDVAASFRSSEG